MSQNPMSLFELSYINMPREDREALLIKYPILYLQFEELKSKRSVNKIENEIINFMNVSRQTLSKCRRLDDDTTKIEMIYCLIYYLEQLRIIDFKDIIDLITVNKKEKLKLAILSTFSKREILSCLHIAHIPGSESWEMENFKARLLKRGKQEVVEYMIENQLDETLLNCLNFRSLIKRKKVVFLDISLTKEDLIGLLSMINQQEEW